MDDVGTRELANQPREVREFVDDGAQVFDFCCGPEQSRQRGVDRDEPRIDVGIVPPRLKQSIGLNGLTSEDLQRRGDDGYLKLSHESARDSAKLRPVLSRYFISCGSACSAAKRRWPTGIRLA